MSNTNFTPAEVEIWQRAQLELVTQLLNLLPSVHIKGLLEDWKQILGDSPTVTEERVLPEGKRVVRTKSSGDRVYYIDEEKKTRQWVTNGEVLGKLGFEMEDVSEIEDGELLKYNMASAIYKVDES